MPTFLFKLSPTPLFPQVSLEVGVEDVYRPGSVLDIPKRPPWSYKMSKHQVERQEEDMFESYLHKIHTTFKRKDLSYFEHNLEVIMMMMLKLVYHICLSVCLFPDLETTLACAGVIRRYSTYH